MDIVSSNGWHFHKTNTFNISSDPIFRGVGVKHITGSHGLAVPCEKVKEHMCAMLYSTNDTTSLKGINFYLIHRLR